MDYVDIAATLRWKRRALGLNQQEAADLAGFDRRTLSNFESGSGSRSISLRNLLALTEVLGVRLTIDTRPSASELD